MNRRISGFALPSVLIASIIMLDVLLVSVTSTAAVRVALTNQGYSQLSQTAGEAGTAYAQACLDANGGVAQWSNEKPLKPDTDCYGNPLDTGICPADPTNACHFVSVNDGGNTTFSVGIDSSEVPAIDGMKKISSGELFSCGISSNDLAYCWGSNMGGQLGDGTTNDSKVPVAVDTSGLLAGKTILDIGTFYQHACVLASDNKAYCWGSNSYGQLGNKSNISSYTPVAVDTSGISGLTIKQISVGYLHTCAIMSNSKPYCWGLGGQAQLGTAPVSLTSYNVPTAVYTGAAPFNTLTAISISAGYQHTCAIASDNYAYCWGFDGQGQIGDNTTTFNYVYVPVAVDRVTGTPVLSGKTVTQISAGYNHTCAITFDNIAACWGYGANGQLGHNSAPSYSVIPVAVIRTNMTTAMNVRYISAGYYHTCAIADGSAWCWGSGAYGKLGYNNTTSYAYPVLVVNSPSDEPLYGKAANIISVSRDHSCAIASGQAYCWGNNNIFGKLGNNNTVYSTKPVTVNIVGTAVKQIVSKGTTNLTRSSDGSTWRDDSQTIRLNLAELAQLSELTLNSVSTGDYHTCAISDANYAYCWGQNSPSYAQLGDNSIDDALLPREVYTAGVLSGKTVAEISAGLGHTCAIADGLAYCWGYDGSGQLGNGVTTTTPYRTPVAVSTAGVLSGKTIVRIETGDNHSCALTSDNLVACWGSNSQGQLGINSATPTSSNVPVLIDTSGALSGKTINDIALGAFHTCVVANSQPYCWGYNANGQIGNSTTTTPILTPTATTTSGVLSGRTVTSIAAGYYHTCAVADGLAFCWGSDTNGKLGDDVAIASKTSPVAVDATGVLSGKTVTDISTGSQSTCAVASGLAYCWGLGQWGKLGNNGETSFSVPTDVSATGNIKGRTIISIDINLDHGCVVSSEPKVYCWGVNSDGQLGANSTSQSLVPLPVYTKGISYFPVGF